MNNRNARSLTPDQTRLLKAWRRIPDSLKRSYLEIIMHAAEATKDDGTRKDRRDQMRVDIREFERFWKTYEQMAESGKCDSAGGMEFYRVFSEWRLSGSPPELQRFIYRRANVGPEGTEPNEEALTSAGLSETLT